MIYKFSITYKVTNFERVPGSCIIKKIEKNKLAQTYITDALTY